MSYWKTLEQMKNETPEERRLREKLRMEREQEIEEQMKKERETAINTLKDLLPSFLNMQENAHDQKDRLTYICATGAIFYLDSVEAFTDTIPTYEIANLALFFRQLPDNINIDNMFKLKSLCSSSHSVDIRNYRVHPDFYCTNYSIGDLIGMGIRILDAPEKMKEYTPFQ